MAKLGRWAAMHPVASWWRLVYAVQPQPCALLSRQEDLMIAGGLERKCLNGSNCSSYGQR
jgi:hypothetical protein